MLWLSPHEVRDPWRTIIMFFFILMAFYSLGVVTVDWTPRLWQFNRILSAAVVGYVVSCFIWAIWPDLTEAPYSRSIPLVCMVGFPTLVSIMWWLP